jgi:hypothetical protein
MNEGIKELLKQAHGYAATRGIEITVPLGSGLHGSVWKISGKERNLPWVLKLHRHASPWRRERDCYRRLQETGTSSIAGVNLPQLIWDDEEWLAIEMSMVKRPFLLDFGAAWLDERPEFPQGVWEQAEADGAEKFGEDWPRASAVLDALEAETGVIMGDVHPGNLALR